MHSQMINNAADLRAAIQKLEQKSTVQQEDLKIKLHDTKEMLRPGNLIKSAIHDVSATPAIKQNIVNKGIGFGIGVLANRLIFGGRGGLLKKLAGKAFTLGVANLVSRKIPKLMAKDKPRLSVNR